MQGHKITEFNIRLEYAPVTVKH